MRLLPLLLLSAASVANARTPLPAPAPGAVPDREVARLLSDEYGEKVRMRGHWRAKEDFSATHELCADSGLQRGDRLVALCTDYDNSQTARVDIYVLEPAATSSGKPRIRSRFRGIERDAVAGHASVALMPIAPGRTAFAITVSDSADGWTHATQSLYAERDGELRKVLGVGTVIDNRDLCRPGADVPGRRCRRQSVSLTCALHADTSRLDAGAWPLELLVNGQRGGVAVHRVVPIPHDAYGYRVSARVLTTQGCDAAK